MKDFLKCHNLLSRLGSKKLNIIQYGTMFIMLYKSIFMACLVVCEYIKEYDDLKVMHKLIHLL